MSKILKQVREFFPGAIRVRVVGKDVFVDVMTDRDTIVSRLGTSPRSCDLRDRILKAGQAVWS